jgi:acetyl esterase
MPLPMTAEPHTGIPFEVEDVEYLRHAEQPLLARLFRPHGDGPFPALVMLHGGAWCMYDRIRESPVCEPLAASGILVASIDFRMPPEAGYPASLADANYAVRWLKLQAEELGTRAELVGVAGVSSGGHQAILGAMRPRDARYAAIPLEGGADIDATVAFAAACWPVIDPLGRYRYMQQLRDDGLDDGMADNVLPAQDSYWGTEDAMAEGSPLRILERGEPSERPDILCVQSAVDRAHPRPQLERFAELYTAAGGSIELAIFGDDAGQFALRTVASPAAVLGIEAIAEFVHARAAVAATG